MRWTLFLITASLLAAPSIREISPRGAQRGKTLTLVLRGSDLIPGSRLETTLPGSISRMAPAKDELDLPPNSELPFLVQLKADAPVGLYPIRVISSDGLSNVVLFAVGEFPEVEEREAANPKLLNDMPEKAESITTPVTVNGTLGPADEDQYTFTLKAPQKLVFEVEARRAGSAIDPFVEVFDAAGKVVAKNDDGPGISPDTRMHVAFTRPGQYRVLVRDSRYSDQVQNFYRLKIGRYPYAETMFPLGWRRGEPVEVELGGGNLPAPVKVKASGNTVQAPGSAALPLQFSSSDKTETIEPAAAGPHPLAEGTVVNGRIFQAAEIDRYQLTVKPGEQWIFEIQAASTGASQLDALLTAFDEKGKKLASRDDTAGADSVLPLTIPEGVTSITLAVEDLLRRGGPGYSYRLEARRGPPDFIVDLATPFVNVPAGGTMQIVAVVQRRGYDGPIRLRIPDLPPGFTVAGGHIPSEAAAQSFNNDNAGFRSARSVMTITAAEDAPREPREITVIAEADTPNGKITRVARGPGLVTPVRGIRQQAFSAPWLGMRLPVAVSKPLPLTLASPTPYIRISQGFEYTLDYRVRRRSGAPAPGRVNNQQAGAVGNLRVNRGTAARTADAGNVLVATNFATPLTTFDMYFETQVDIEGRPVSITSPAVSIEVVQGYELQLTSKQIQIDPGGRAEIAGTVFREPTFEGGLVRINVEDLPDGVTCAGAEVAASETRFAIACQAGVAAAAGRYPVRLASVAPETGRKAKEDYKIPDVETTLVVTGAQKASTR